MKDILGTILSFAYVILVLIIAKKVEAKGWVSPFAARKWVHLLVGSWILPTFFLFDHWYTAIVPPFCFIWANLYMARKRAFSFETEEAGYGTVYFPISFVFLLTLFWGDAVRGYAALGGLVMAWGDPLAALVGKRWGLHRYPIGQTQKSFEGTLAMGGGAFAACFVSFLLFQHWTFKEMVMSSGILAVFSAVVESLSGRGLDNLTVPLGAAWLSYFLFARF